jgi:hypothetical protein
MKSMRCSAPRPSIGVLWRALVLAATLASAPDAQAPAQAPVPIGMNLRPITAYDRSWAFTDAMKMASEWRYDDERPDQKFARGGVRGEHHASVPLDRDGWPRPSANRAVSCQFFTGMQGQFPRGEYVVTWKGKATVEFRGHARVVSQAPRRLAVEVDGPNRVPLGLGLRNVDRVDPIRDIHVWLPGFEETCHSFHPLFLERLRPFSVLRFYQWMKIYSTTGRWLDRPTPATGRQGGPEGVALEYMVELCNELGADPWFCIPHTADDDFVRRFATLVRESLRHDARVYVEFSNETWNTDFVAGRWARAEAQERGIQAMQVVAERAGQVFDIWREVFAGKESRVVRVAGAQLHNLGVANTLCRSLNGRFDAIAVGAYFGARADRDAVDQDSTAAELMSVARANIDAVVLPRVRDHRTLANTFATELGRPIALVTYEGGQSIVARSPGGGLGLEATLACQTMPEMFTAYRALIDGATANGVELFVAYDFAGPRGSADTFSVLEHIDEDLARAVKYRALIQGWESRGQ